MKQRAQKVYRFKVTWREMDMSGGDAVDGPRWTGAHIDVEREDFIVVAPTEELAEEALLLNFYGHEKAIALEREEIGKVNCIVGVSGDRNH